MRRPLKTVRRLLIKGVGGLVHFSEIFKPVYQLAFLITNSEITSQSSDMKGIWVSKNLTAIDKAANKKKIFEE